MPATVSTIGHGCQAPGVVDDSWMATSACLCRQGRTRESRPENLTERSTLSNGHCAWAPCWTRNWRGGDRGHCDDRIARARVCLRTSGRRGRAENRDRSLPRLWDVPGVRPPPENLQAHRLSPRAPSPDLVQRRNTGVQRPPPAPLEGPGKSTGRWDWAATPLRLQRLRQLATSNGDSCQAGQNHLLGVGRGYLRADVRRVHPNSGDPRRHVPKRCLATGAV